jgi:ATP-dependent Clp protease ATP-binding subunit ClpA
VKLLQRSRRMPRSQTFRPAERYLAAGADVARRLGHDAIGTEHVLVALLRHPESAAVRVLAQLSVSAADAEEALACWLPDRSASGKIDPGALAQMGIDFDVVRERLEQTFGPGALERTPSTCLGITPRLKQALAYALDHAGASPLADEHVLLGMLDVPGSVAARALGTLGVSLERAKGVRPHPRRAGT